MTRAALLILLLVGAACAHKRVAPTPNAPSDNSHLDLTAGSRLRILVPLLKGQDKELAFEYPQSNGSTITAKATNLLGYEFAYYSVERDQGGKVHLKFTSAEITKDGQSLPDTAPPKLPFPFPAKPAFVRLVFLIRVSESDHNMAILAADSRGALEDLTTQVRLNPLACQIRATGFCVWVPQSIAVRPEPPPSKVSSHS